MAARSGAVGSHTVHVGNKGCRRPVRNPISSSATNRFDTVSQHARDLSGGVAVAGQVDEWIMTETTDKAAIMYEANRGDWARLRLYAVNRVYPWFRFYFPIVWVFCCLPAVFIGNTLWKAYVRLGPSGFARIPHRIMVAYLIAALAGPCFALILQLMVPWIARLGNSRKPNARGVGIDPGGVSSITAQGSVTVPWWAINDIRFDRGATYFFSGKLNAVVLPRRVHASKGEARSYFERAVSLWQERRRVNVDPFQHHHVVFLPEQMEFREFVLKIQKAYSFTNPRGMLSVIAWILLFFLYLYAKLAHALQIEVVPVWVAWAGCIALLIVSMRIDPLTSFMRRLSRVDGVQDPAEATIDRQGVRYVTLAGPHWFAWRDITKVASSRSVIALLATGHEPIIIPKRAFCTPGAAEAFLETARAYHAGLAVEEGEGVWPPSPETA